MNKATHSIPPTSAFITAYNEVMGEIDGSVTRAQSDFEGSSMYLTGLCDRLAAHFQSPCACGLAQQIGRSAFIHLFRQNNGLSGLTDQSFRLMPGRLRLMRGFDQLEKLIERIFEISVDVVDAVDTIRMKTNDDSTQHDLIPYLEAGFIQEYLHWVSGGKPHTVMVEGRRPDWSVVVDKQPLDA